MNFRIFVEKKPSFRVEANELREDLNLNLKLNLKNLRLLNVYDLFDFSETLVKKAKYKVFGEVQTDDVYDEIDLTDKKYLAVEFLPGQYDQRGEQARYAVNLIDPLANIYVKSARLIIFDEISDEDLARVKKYYINKVESREKDLSTLEYNNKGILKEVAVYKGFKDYSDSELEAMILSLGLAMNLDDLKCVRTYFKEEGRDPNETEIRILDTYWSDHCRHTTFNTVLEEVTIDDFFMKSRLEEAYDLYRKMRKELDRDDRKICLMDMATIAAKYLKKCGYLDDLEESEENNACSIFVNVDVDNKKEKWLLQFKNETHNHPTEIEPFGGASTCLGGAIRDPLSGRSYVYQACRVTGAGDIYESVDETLVGKLPQRIISTKAAQGYSSYGNQIGLATTHVREIYDDGYKAKRLEVGAVVGAVKYENVRRESPKPGDVVIMLGGRTGRDGIGGATGSSKEHNVKSIEECFSEVQKGNAIEERKIERLFRRPEVIRLIKKSNDFGAGGVSVAIGELAPSLDIYLDRVLVKYNGLNQTELAISESQERMSVVVSKEDMNEFMSYCREENLEAVHIADVTATGAMRMFYEGKKCVDLKRSFIDSAGASHFAKVHISGIEKEDPFNRDIQGNNLAEKFINNLRDRNVLSQKGLIEMFDATIGRSTVLMPFGGKYQLSETQVSVQKLPVNGYTDLASILAYGYNPHISSYSPFLGSQYAVVESIAKVVAAGASYDHMRYSYQEYFKRMQTKEDWGLPFQALLGAIKIQNDFKLPSIGGKDSMSGTFQNLHVPPMLMAFGITTVDANDVISTEFKEVGNHLYLVKHHPTPDFNPNVFELKENFNNITKAIKAGKIISAYALGFGGLSEALAKMSFGNKIGFDVNTNEDLFALSYGSILVEAKEELPFGIFLGKTSTICQVNGTTLNLDDLLKANTEKFETVYKNKTDARGEVKSVAHENKEFTYPYEAKTPLVYVPAFPGTNCDYDTMKAFKKVGAKTSTSVFKNITPADVLASIEEMARHISEADILVLSGGFSASDEPDGSAKFIANVLMSDKVKVEINKLLARKGLILGICNGFQALVKSGLLPYGRLGELTEESPTLFRNDINRHVSMMVNTKVSTINSPWLASFKDGDIYSIAVSHGEGKFVASEKLAADLFKNGQVAFQYVDDEGVPTMTYPMNPNGSGWAIEGIVSSDGLILGKMGHTERYEKNLFKNISGNKHQDIFTNAMNYFRKK